MHVHGFFSRLVIAVLITLPSLAGAAVALVPEWTLTPASPSTGTLAYDGVHLYDVPSMQSRGVHRELPATRSAAVSADGSRLYLWNQDDGSTLYVYDLPSFTLHHAWPAFAGDRRLSNYATVHPRQPVLIFGGMDWFDAETGIWTQSPETLHIDRFNSLPTVSEDKHWLSFVAPRHLDGSSTDPLTAFALDLDDPVQRMSFDFPGIPFSDRVPTLVDQGGTRILLSLPSPAARVAAYRLPAGSLLYDVSLAPTVVYVDSIIGVNGDAIVSTTAAGDGVPNSHEVQIYTVSASGESSVLLHLPTFGETATLQSSGSDLLRVGTVSELCPDSCIFYGSTLSGFTSNGSGAHTLFFDAGTYANAPLLVSDSVFGNAASDTALPAPVDSLAALMALASLLIAIGGVVARRMEVPAK